MLSAPRRKGNGLVSFAIDSWEMILGESKTAAPDGASPVLFFYFSFCRYIELRVSSSDCDSAVTVTSPEMALSFGWWYSSSLSCTTILL